jgi:methyl-accepting chemotaxis protein
MLMKNLSIGKRLALVLGAILALLVITSGLAMVMLQQLGQEVEVMLERNTRTERLAVDWSMNLNAAVQRRAAISKSQDPALKAYFAEANAQSVRVTGEFQKQIDEQLNSSGDRAALEEVNARRKTYQTVRDAVTKLKDAGDEAAAGRLFDEKFDPAARAYQEAVQKVVSMQRQQLDARGAQVLALRSRTLWLLSVSAGVGLVLGVVLAWVLSRSIVGPVRQSHAIAVEIGSMDLRGQPQTAYSRDETGALLQALDRMRAALRNTLLEVRGVVDGVHTASQEIAAGNMDLSARTESTAGSLEETASAMEELTSTVRQSADAASQASQLALTAVDVAQRGGQLMGTVVQTMDRIHTSSGRIADIIGVIDGIAFQTNILALNAAVEAARAGEQGRGFAVVASEVRALAQRSAAAAKEIKTLIDDSVGEVGTGSTQIREAGATVGQIVDSIQKVRDIVSEISVATREQSQGIAQINVAINQLDQMTQQNSALVEQSAAAAGSLNEQAQRLSRAVAAFQFEDGVHGGAARLAHTPSAQQALRA